MATDTRFGLVVGVGVVLAVAVIYFPKAGHAERTNAVVPSLPAATHGTDTAMRPPVSMPAARFDRR